MQTKLWTTIIAWASVLVLTACQTATQNSTAIKQIDTVQIDIPILTISLDSDGDGISDELDMCPNTQQNAVVNDRGCHFTTGPEMGLKMEPRVFFEKGSSKVSPKYFNQLDQVGIKMREYDTATMRIEGSISENEINDSTLSKNRALIVKNYLIMQYKIASERLTTFDCSARVPIASNDTEEGRAMNRRVYGLVTRSDEDVYKTYQEYSELDQCVEFK